MNVFSEGDIVRVKKKCVKYHATHLGENLIVPSQRNFEEKDLNWVHMWLDAFINKYSPVGCVVGFGSTDEDDVTRKYVRVEFFHRGEFDFSYFSESDLKELK